MYSHTLRASKKTIIYQIFSQRVGKGLQCYIQSIFTENHEQICGEKTISLLKIYSRYKKFRLEIHYNII